MKRMILLLAFVSLFLVGGKHAHHTKTDTVLCVQSYMRNNPLYTSADEHIFLSCFDKMRHGNREEYRRIARLTQNQLTPSTSSSSSLDQPSNPSIDAILLIAIKQEHELRLEQLRKDCTYLRLKASLDKKKLYLSSAAAIAGGIASVSQFIYILMS